ncbi:MAG: phosphoribosyltransferase family protein [Chloroflexota bacterium]
MTEPSSAGETRLTHEPTDVFRDRVDAGTRLAEEMARRPRLEWPDLVLGIPRGGVVVAAEIARRLELELDVIVARKLGSPISEELAIGAVTANGGRFLNEEVIRELGVSQEFKRSETRRQRAAARRREALLRGDRPARSIRGRRVLVVDDGLATGSTMLAAVRSVARQEPAWIVVAVPVGSPEACATLRAELTGRGEVLCLLEPDPFWAVGVHYARFDQTEDEEVRLLLEEARVRHAAGESR